MRSGEASTHLAIEGNEVGEDDDKDKDPQGHARIHSCGEEEECTV